MPGPEPRSLPEVTAASNDLEELENARELNWVARSDRGYEVLRHGEGLDVLGDTRLLKGPSFHRRLDDFGLIDDPIRDHWNKMVTCLEGEDRKRMRVPLAGLFRPAQVAKLQSAVAGIVADVLDELEASDVDLRDVDLMQDVAWKIPPRVYCHLVSAPHDLAPTVARLADSIVGPLLTNDQSRRQESIDALYESLAFVAEHIAARREDLGDDFTSAMIRQQLDGKLTEDEVLHEAAALLQASVDNTVHQIGIVFGQLLSERSRWESVLADQELVPQAVEESIRLRPRFNTIFRQADGDVEFRDQVFEDGSWVFVSVRATQRDPRVFPDPAEFRLDRPTHRAMMFGGGPYNCLGQHLARMEFHETLKAVQRRFPAARLVDDWAVHETNAVTEVTHLRAALV